MREFYAWEHETPELTPLVGEAFLRGYEITMATDSIAEVATQIASVLPRQVRGFAMEGAGMAAGLRAGIEPWNRSLFRDLVTVAGERHAYMLYVGLGWALARLPRPVWPRLDITDPLLRPLIWDGYGFHQCFFDTENTLAAGGLRLVPARVLDRLEENVQNYLWQGVGRALWFVCGGSPTTVARTVQDTFPAEAQPDLWAGVGLAAAYAGGVPDLVRFELLEAAAGNTGWVRQGAAFGIEARVRAGLVTDDTRAAARVLLGRVPEDVAQLVVYRRPRSDLVETGMRNPYTVWRRELAGALE